MSGYASKAEAVQVVRATIAGTSRPADLPADPAAYNMAGIARAVVYSRGTGYGWGIEHSAETFWAAVRANLKVQPVELPHAGVTVIAPHVADILTGDSPNSLSDALDFDHVVHLSSDGELSHDRRPHWPHAPECLDPSIGSTVAEGGWELITAGLTGQYGYNGPWLHDSEVIAGGVAARVVEHAAEHGGGFYVAVYASFSCEECGGAGQMWNEAGDDEIPCPLIAAGTCEPGSTTIEGWAIAYKAGEVSA